jgi:predicted transcriptional regulator
MRKFFLHCFILILALSAQAQDTTAVYDDSLDARTALSGESAEAREQWLRRQIFVENILMQNAISAGDSLLIFRLQQQTPLSLSKSQLNTIAPRVDRLEEKFRREQLGLPPMSPIGTLIGKGIKYLSEKLSGAPNNPLAVIPSETEIEVMNILWKKNAATSSEIYAGLDSTNTLTAADLQQTLAAMAARGLLDRRQISPRHEMTILGIFTIEESALNRKNREFLYQPRVARQTMLSYLDATAFSHRLASAGNPSLVVDHLRKLMNRLAAREN